MKRVGILTLYNNSSNYGGLAQSFALQQYVSQLGYECKLINYKRMTAPIFHTVAAKRRLVFKVINRFRYILEQYMTKKNLDDINIRKDALKEFRTDSIPHTEEFVDEEVSDCLDLFDIFISGSDQIWKPHVVRQPFVLGFVNDGRPKLSYGSSIAQEVFPPAYDEFMKKGLMDFQFISVREKEAQAYLTQLLNRKIEWVVDPVLLLDTKQWGNLAADRMINQDYVFCYFLGDSLLERRYVRAFSKRLGLKVVTIPYLQNAYKIVDMGLGEIKILKAGMGEFLSLIKNAKYVLTDSFHAVVFSYLFKTNFYVFDRKDFGSAENMNSRITSVLDLMGLKNRHITENVKIDFETMNDIDFNSGLDKELQKKIEESRWMLKTELEKASR